MARCTNEYDVELKIIDDRDRYVSLPVQVSVGCCVRPVQSFVDYYGNACMMDDNATYLVSISTQWE